MTPDQMNPDICSSALEEDGTLDRSKWDGAHKWDGDECAECGTSLTKKAKIALLAKAMTSSKRADDTTYNHFSDEAPESLKSLYLEHYNVKDLYYEIFGRALDIVSEIYADKPERGEEGSDGEIEEEIYERAPESASVYTSDRLAYLDNQNEDEVSETMRDYGMRSIADACAAWYDRQVEQAAIIIKDWVVA